MIQREPLGSPASALHPEAQQVKCVKTKTSIRAQNRNHRVTKQQTQRQLSHGSHLLPVLNEVDSSRGLRVVRKCFVLSLWPSVGAPSRPLWQVGPRLTLDRTGGICPVGLVGPGSPVLRSAWLLGAASVPRLHPQTWGVLTLLLTDRIFCSGWHWHHGALARVLYQDHSSSLCTRAWGMLRRGTHLAVGLPGPGGVGGALPNL